MGKGHRNLNRERFLDMSIPLSWDDYQYFLTRELGFVMEKKKGGRGVSFTKGSETFTAFIGHGSKRIESNVRRDDRKKAKFALIRLGEIPEEG
jgi:hypothetical protein